MSRDAGPDINKRGCTGLANAMQKDFLNTWLLNNQENFIEAMDMLKEHNPAKYSELYLKAVQMGLVRETNINLNIGRQQDYDNLQALVNVRVKPKLPNSGAYTPYEEVRHPQMVEERSSLDYPSDQHGIEGL